MQIQTHNIPPSLQGNYNGIANPFAYPVETPSEAHKMLFLHFLLPMVLVAMAINLWLGFFRPMEYYHRHDAPQSTTTNHHEFYEDWLLLDSKGETEHLLPATRYNGVKENPLSPEEVDRLLSFIRAEEGEIDIPRSSAGRKRKATGDEDSPISDSAMNGGSVSPRTRKLKIETDFGVDHRWVSKVSDYRSCVRDEDVFDQSAGSGEFPFTFRASHPDRDIKFPSKLRSKN